MDSSRSKTHRKRQRENENGACPPQRKSPRLLAKIQPPSQSPMKITDMNDDCLEKTFMHLDLVSLFNVSVASEWLRPAARIVYRRRFGTKLIHILGDPVCSSAVGPLEMDKRIKVRGLKACLQYLRCFGPSVSKLLIRYDDWNTEQCIHIHWYINNYCAESLKTILFMDKPISVTINRFVKPFVNIQRVEVYNGDLGNQLASFPQWFPNLKDLRLFNVHMDNSGIAMPFDRLKRLHVDMAFGNLNNISQLLTLCRQLRSLIYSMSSRCGPNMTQVLNMIKNNHDIRTLIVSNFTWIGVDPLEMHRLFDEHSALRELDLSCYKFTAVSAITMIHQLGSLRKIRLGMSNALECDRFVSELNMIGQWQHSSYTDFENHRLIILNR